MPTWPTDLPQDLLIDGFQGGFSNTIIRTQMESGVAKVRRRFTKSVEPISGRQILTDSQMQILRSFFEETLSGGALSFDWLHPQTGDSVKMRFVQPVQYSRTGPYWNAEYNMEILP